MTIASPKVDELARQLARLTGEDVETALERAIEERSSRVVEVPSDNRSQQAKVDHIIRLVRSVRPAGERATGDPTAFLYGNQ